LECKRVEPYLDRVEGWIRAFEVLIYEVHAQARRDHCYEANQEDADDGSCGRLANTPENSACGIATFFPAIDVEFQSGRDWQDENKQVREDVDSGHRVVDRRDIVAVWAVSWERCLPCIGRVLWTLESLVMSVNSTIESPMAVLSLLTLTRIMMTV
jgi:hypothetical protein